MFRIYYGDGSTFEGKPEDAPAKNVQCIVFNDNAPELSNIGRVVLSQWDIYIYSDDIGWHGTNKYADLLQHLGKGIGLGGVRAVLQGTWIARDKYFEIQERAKTDPPFINKSATRPLEDGSE